MSSYVTVSVEADVWLEELDTEDMIEELESRGYSVRPTESCEELTDINMDMMDLYHKLRGHSPNLIETLRTFLTNHTGRIA